MTATPEPSISLDGDVAPGLALLSPTRSSEDLLRALFVDAPVAYAVFDLDSRLVLANRAYHELFGYEAGQMIGMSIDEITHGDDREMTLAYHRDFATGNLDRQEIEKRYLRKDGSVFWGHLVATVLRDPDGDQRGLLGVVEDISSRVATQGLLEASESRFRALVQHANDAIFVVDELGNLLYATPSAGRMTGADIDEQLGKSVLDWVHEDDVAVVMQSFIETAGRPGTAVPLRMRIRHVDGSTRFVEVIASNLLDDPVISGIVFNVRDITDSQEVANALEMTQNRFKALIENISDTVTLIDEHGTVLLSTGNVRPILGFPTEFWNRLSLFDLVHPDDLARMQGSFLEILATPGKEMQGEARVRGADGDYIDAEINAVNLIHDPAVQGIVLTTRNVSAHKQHEAELAQARDQAIRALDMRTEFIASVSHELRTPIHGVLGLSELLATADLDDEARGLARSITRAAESLRMVLDDILDFSKIEVGRLEINLESVRPAEIGRDIEAIFGAQAKAKGIDLTISRSSDLPEWVLGDALRVRQVANNLVSNAIKFTFEGSVRVSAKRVVVDDGSGDLIRVSVKDTGMGIAQEQHDRLFEPFSQAHKANREFGGTGLGLSIAKHLVELMGGEMGFASVLGEGSEFWFTIPLVVAEPVADLRPSDVVVDVRADTSRVIRVMVVEDNPINQLLVRRQLERLGYEVNMYEAGIPAIEAFTETGAVFDVVLMDWQLPGIDGLETTRRIRDWEKDHRRSWPTPIVAMTASALAGDRARCLEAGMDDFIAKPVSLTTLGFVLQRWTAPSATESRFAAAAGGVRHEGGINEGARATGSTPRSIDIEVLRRLVEELDDSLLVVTVARTFLRELGGRVGALDRAITDDDRSALVAAAHTLKSTSAVVGAGTLSQLCQRLEQTARNSATVALPVTAREIQEEAAAVERDLEAALAVIYDGPHP